MRKISISSLSIVVLVASALPALAHTGAGTHFAFGAGFAHPLFGLDHVLAMVSIGALAATIGGRALIVVPLAFVGMMIAGALLGIAGIPLPGAELAIAGSVAVLGALIAIGVKPGLAAAALIAGVFAIFHGHAHGGEMPADASGLGYFAGFVAATALLHAAGIGLGIVAARLGARTGTLALRGAGGAVAAVGVFLVLRAM